MHLFLTGKSEIDKTAFIKRILPEIKNKRGFFTEEIKEKGEGIGLKIVTLQGKEGVFAHKDFLLPFHLGRYGVNVNVFNSFAVAELREVLAGNCEVVVVDEIGKMELFSKELRDVVGEVLEKKTIMGTMSTADEPFLNYLRRRKDVYIIDVDYPVTGAILQNAQGILKSLNVERIRNLETQAKTMGLSERLLIENASSSLFSVIDSLRLGKKVMVFAGSGNNGADVLSCARKLYSHGYDVAVALAGEKPMGIEGAFQKEILEKMQIPIVEITEKNKKILKGLIAEREFILEGILGIGIKREVSAFLKDVFLQINQSGKRVVSCDIPSGLSPDDGKILGAAVKANYTVTFLALKQGFFLNEGKNVCGHVFVVDIGISREALECTKNGFIEKT